MGKSMKLGGGGRFAALKAKVGGKLAAWIGRKKYGKEKFQAMAAHGRERAAAKSSGPSASQQWSKVKYKK